MKRIFILLTTVALMSSCGLYKSYTRPELKTDQLFGEEVGTTDTTTLGNLPWSEVFSDGNLQQLIRTGLENNTDLQIARLRITEAEASLKSARLSYYPSLSLNPEGTLSGFDGSKTTKTYQLPVNASWEVEIFGKLTNARQQQKAALEESEAYRQTVQTQLIASIANSYFTLLMLDRQLEITTQTALSWEENVKTMQALKRAGESNEAGVSQAEANKLSADASVIDLKRQLTEVENALCATLGESPHTVIRGRLEDQLLPEALTIGIPLQLLSNRPDVRSAEASLKQAYYSTQEARSYFYPSLTLSGNIGWTNSGGTGITNPGALLWQAIGSLTQPLFNKGKNRERLEIAKAQQEEAKLIFRQTLLDAGTEVNNALASYQSASQKTGIYENQVVQLESAVRSTRLLMQYGNTTYLEVLTAQQTLLQAELNQVSNRFDEIQAVINLYKALGGGRW